MTKKKAAGIVFIAVLVVLVIGSIRLGFWQYERDDFVFYEHLSDTAVTIDDTDITLQEVSYYIMVLEESANKMALVYNADNPKEFWNIYTNGDFFINLVKNMAFDTCIRDNIYCMEAYKNGISLTEKEKQAAKNEAASIYAGMTGKQKLATGLKEESLTEIKQKQYLSDKYVSYLEENADLSGEDSESDTSDEVKEAAKALEVDAATLDVGGSYYEKIKSGYNVTEDEKLFKNIKMGTVTIN